METTPRNDDGTFKVGHPYYGDKEWSDEEVNILIEHYSYSSQSTLLDLLPRRTSSGIYGKALKLGLSRNKDIGINNRAEAIRESYKDNVEAKAKLRAIGIKLANSPYHHNGHKPGEYTISDTTRMQISETLKRKYRENPEMKEAACEALKKGRAIMRESTGPTYPEVKVQEILESLDIDAKSQYRFKNYFLDFAIPEQKIAILVDGCYWHCCPIHYPLATTVSQQNNLKVDCRREKILKKAGWRAIHVWEHEVDDHAVKTRLEKEVMPCVS